MAESQTDVIIKLVQMALITAILILIIYRKRKYQIQQLNWLIFIFAMADLQGLLEISIYYLKTSVLMIENTSHFRFNEFHTIPYSLSIFGIYLLAEAMTNRNPNPFRFGLVLSLWTSYISLMFFQTFHEYALTFPTRPASNQFFNVMFDLFQLSALLFATYIFFLSFLNSKNPQNRRATFLLFFAVAIYVMVLGYELGENLLGFPDVYGAITFSLTFIILAIVYVKWPYYVLTVPVSVYRLVLATSGGVHIYSAELNRAEDLASDELLVSGVSAITSFMAEALGSHQSLEYADFGDRSLLVHRSEDIIGFLIADRPSRILSSALGQFVSEFSLIYSNETSKMKNQQILHSNAKGIISKCFPFVESSDIIRMRQKEKI